MQPRANIMARAELHTSAPSAMFWTSEKPVRDFPDAMTVI
jgi:hypothetical protein